MINADRAVRLKVSGKAVGLGSIGLICVMVLGGRAESKEASDPDESALAQEPFSAEDLSGRYCGIYSVYACLDLFGKAPSFESLVEPQYVGSFEGTNLAELKRAVDNHGAYAVAMTGLTVDMLRQSPYPVIIHLKSVRSWSEYNHWGVYLGTDGELARLLDPPRPLEALSFTQLLARWDGTGLVVSDAPVQTGALVWPRRWRLAAYALLAAAAIAIVRQFGGRYMATPNRRGPVRTVVLPACVLLVFAGAVSGVQHSFWQHGFFKNPQTVAAIVAANHSKFLPEVETEDVRRLLGRDDVVIVDARRTIDYQSGHIEGAINLSVNASLSEREQVFSQIPKNAQVVVYCQSRGCSWDEKVADMLWFNGFEHVSLYTAGWVEWKKNANAE